METFSSSITNSKPLWNWINWWVILAMWAHYRLMRGMLLLKKERMKRKKCTEITMDFWKMRWENPCPPKLIKSRKESNSIDPDSFYFFIFLSFLPYPSPKLEQPSLSSLFSFCSCSSQPDCWMYVLPTGMIEEWNPKLYQNFITLKTHLSSSSSFPLNIMFHTNPIKRIKERNSNGQDNINFSISIRWIKTTE
jgi:hypothetical protein